MQEQRSWDIHDEKAAYLLGFYAPTILFAVNLLTDTLSSHISHTEILKAISPLKAAIRRIFPKKDAELQIQKLNEIYILFKKLKIGPIRDDREGHSIICTIEDMCNEIEEYIDEYAEGIFGGRAKALYKSGNLLGLWDICEKPSLKLSDNKLNLLVSNLIAANLNDAAKRCQELNKMENDEFEAAHYPAIWKVHTNIMEKLDLEIAQSEITKNRSLSSLTGLPNLRQFDKDTIFLLSNPMLPVTLAFIDIDNLKALNKKVGHDGADCVIQQVADIIKASLSYRGDVYHRSGDEFMVTLRNTAAQEAISILKRVVENVKSADYHTSKGIQKITISVGVACYPEHGLEVSTLKQHANEAMKISKELGKARVTLWKDKDD